MSAPVILVNLRKLIRTLALWIALLAALCALTICRESSTALSMLVGFGFGFHVGAAFVVLLCKRRGIIA